MSKPLRHMSIEAFSKWMGNVKDPIERHRFAISYLYEQCAWIESVGNGIVVNVHPGGGYEPVRLVAKRTSMKAFQLHHKDGKKTVKENPVDSWLLQNGLKRVDGLRFDPEADRPIFEHDGQKFINTYAPPEHPEEGGDTAAFDKYLERLLPKKVEREWFLQWLRHKLLYPWIPMTAVIMVARVFGTGRNTLLEIVAKLFGQKYVKELDFGDLTGSKPSARFNASYSDALIAHVDEAEEASDGGRFQQRLHAYEIIKTIIDPRGTRMRKYEQKFLPAFFWRCPTSHIILSNHNDALKLPTPERRFTVLTNPDRALTFAERKEIRDWFKDPKNVGALFRKLRDMPAADPAAFDPYMPLETEAKAEMQYLAKTELDLDYESAIETLPGEILVPSQVATLARILGGWTGDYSVRTASVAGMAKRRLIKFRDRGEPHDRVLWDGRREVLYVRSAKAKRFRSQVEKGFIDAQLEANEACIKEWESGKAAKAEVKKEQQEADTVAAFQKAAEMAGKKLN